jgi:UDP-N-acetylmuramoyl-tripeptide--D-alanyl-D-alanine ligase
MKGFTVKILQWKLKKVAQLTVWRYRPGVVGVTGSVGKTSTKMAIAAVLGGGRAVRASKGNLNTALGLPLAIVGDWPEESLALVSRDTPPGERLFAKLRFWFTVLVRSWWNLLTMPRSRYPEVLVLEYGADRPGDIRRLLGIARPNVAVVTAIGETPVHVEFYQNAGAVAREKARLIERLPAAGFAILNRDDAAVMDLRGRTPAHVVTFGFGADSDVRIVRFEHRVEHGIPVGISFKLGYGGDVVPVRLDGVFGRPAAYAAAAAAAVGLVFGMNLVAISEALKSFRPVHGRMELLPGIKGSRVIDDSYNASPLSVKAALEALKDLPALRRVAVLGDMLELGGVGMEAHREVGRFAGQFADLLVTVGERAKFIAEGAKSVGLPRGSIRLFETADEAVGPVGRFIRTGDLVLVKGSRAMELEKVVEELKIR